MRSGVSFQSVRGFLDSLRRLHDRTFQISRVKLREFPESGHDSRERFSGFVKRASQLLPVLAHLGRIARG